MSKSTKYYNKINWSEHFYLDETSPSGLRWNRDVYTGRYRKICVRNKGDVAGSVISRKSGEPSCWQVKSLGTSHQVHRIIWKIIHGSIDTGLMIDHINGNPLDNKPTNLRLVTNRTNQQNRDNTFANKSGTIGVCMINNKGVITYLAHCMNTDGSRSKKSFSTKKYGMSGAFRLACEYRAAQIALLNENGANYTLRHGSA